MVGLFYMDELSSKEVSHLIWHPTSIWQKAVFFITRQPIYQFQTKSYISDLCNLWDWKVTIEQINDTERQFKVKEWSDRGFSDYTKFFAKDEIAISTLSIMK